MLGKRDPTLRSSCPSARPRRLHGLLWPGIRGVHAHAGHSHAGHGSTLPMSIRATQGKGRGGRQTMEPRGNGHSAQRGSSGTVRQAERKKAGFYRNHLTDGKPNPLNREGRPPHPGSGCLLPSTLRCSPQTDGTQQEHPPPKEPTFWWERGRQQTFQRTGSCQLTCMLRRK